MKIIRADFLAYLVSDLKRSAAFYDHSAPEERWQ